MAKREIQVGSTDQTIDIFVPNSASTAGAGLTGLVYNSAGLTCYYRKGPTGTVTALSLATQTVDGAHSDGGFVEVDATNAPGQYRLDLSDAMVNALGTLVIYLKGATNMAPVVIEIAVVAFNPLDSVRLGLTALPNAAADAAGGLPVSDAGGLDIDTRMGKLADGGFTAATLAADTNSYGAKVWLNRKGTATATDRWTVVFRKNEADIVAGVTDPKIQVIKAEDGTDLVAETALTQIGALGLWKHDETTGLLTAGEVYIVKITATIDGATRTMYWSQGRDVAA